jgi:hypothetical protein
MAVYPTYEIAGLSRFRFWCQKVLPAVYDDSLTYYELLCKVIHKLNELIEKDNEQSEVINVLIKELEELRGLFDKFVNSGFDDYYKKRIDDWINTHLEYIFSAVVKQVYFGLTLDGYFVAYIPDGWDDIVFDTGMNYGEDTYGRLILRWDVDESGHSVNQRPEEWR